MCVQARVFLVGGAMSQQLPLPLLAVTPLLQLTQLDLEALWREGWVAAVQQTLWHLPGPPQELLPTVVSVPGLLKARETQEGPVEAPRPSPEAELQAECSSLGTAGDPVVAQALAQLDSGLWAWKTQGRHKPSLAFPFLASKMRITRLRLKAKPKPPPQI